MDDLQRIVDGLARIEGKVDAFLAKNAPRTTAGGPGVAAGAVANDAELDSKFGDPTLKKSPPRHEGRDLAGLRYSQLTAPELECLIGFLDWKATKNDTEEGDDAKKFAGYARKDAARARGWLARVQAGKVSAPAHDIESDEIPF